MPTPNPRPSTTSAPTARAKSIRSLGLGRALHGAHAQPTDRVLASTFWRAPMEASAKRHVPAPCVVVSLDEARSRFAAKRREGDEDDPSPRER